MFNESSGYSETLHSEKLTLLNFLIEDNWKYGSLWEEGKTEEWGPMFYVYEKIIKIFIVPLLKFENMKNAIIKIYIVSCFWQCSQDKKSIFSCQLLSTTHLR